MIFAYGITYLDVDEEVKEAAAKLYQQYLDSKPDEWLEDALDEKVSKAADGSIIVDQKKIKKTVKNQPLMK